MKTARMLFPQRKHVEMLRMAQHSGLENDNYSMKRLTMAKVVRLLVSCESFVRAFNVMTKDRLFGPDDCDLVLMGP